MILLRPFSVALAFALALPGGATAGRVCPPARLSEPLPGVEEVTLHQSDVSTAQFPGQWQEGVFGEAKLAYRLFSDGSGTVSSDLRLRGWHVDFTCNLQTQSCTYNTTAAPPAIALETAQAIGACLTASVPRSRPRPDFPQAAAPASPVAGHPLSSGDPGNAQGAATASKAKLSPAPVAGTKAAVAPKATAAVLPLTGTAPQSHDVRAPQPGDPAPRPAPSGKVGAPATAATAPAPVLAAPATTSATTAPARPQGSHQAAGGTASAPVAKRTSAPATPADGQIGAARPDASAATTAAPRADQDKTGDAPAQTLPLPAQPQRARPGVPQAGLDLVAQCPARAETALPPPPPVCWIDRLPEEPAIAQIQRLLLLAGYDPGPLDGRLGTRTHKALVRALGKERAQAPAAEMLADLRETLCDAPHDK